MTVAQKDDFLRHYQPLHERFARYCRGRAFGITEAEDLMQEALLTALGRWERLRDKDKLLSYLIGIVNNLVRNQRRKRREAEPPTEAQMAELESQVGSAEIALDIQYLLKAMQQLPEQQRMALELFELSGFSIKEVAEIQHSSEGAVKTRLSRARKALQETLAEDGRRLTVAERLSIYASILL